MACTLAQCALFLQAHSRPSPPGRIVLRGKWRRGRPVQLPSLQATPARRADETPRPVPAIVGVDLTAEFGPCLLSQLPLLSVSPASGMLGRAAMESTRNKDGSRHWLSTPDRHPAPCRFLFFRVACRSDASCLGPSCRRPVGRGLRLHMRRTFKGNSGKKMRLIRNC